MFVICHNDYPIGVEETEEVTKQKIQELQERYNYLYQKLRGHSGPAGFFHYRECGIIEVNRYLFKRFLGWDETYLTRLLTQLEESKKLERGEKR